ncbi:anti-sigma factor family protein [Thiobacter aerophilum]|uniref:Anti-sigma factor n=1 Tax=Thiobacter aerophilum TaxID=3121275 RepID=A0ABV0ED60_9BURK
MREIDEHSLHAYLDDALDGPRRAQVEAYLAQHPDAAARVSAWRHQKEALHALFDPVLEEPLPARLKPPARALPALRYAAMLGWLGVGAALGWLARGDAPAPGPLASLPREAAVAHVVYAPEVLHPVEVGAEQQAHLVKWLSKRLGAELNAPDLAPSGFHLMGGRLLPADDGPAAQFMYQDSQGRRLSLYVRVLSGTARETAFRFERKDGVSVFYWVDGRFGYALSGELDRARLLEIATSVYHQLG